MAVQTDQLHAMIAALAGSQALLIDVLRRRGSIAQDDIDYILTVTARDRKGAKSGTLFEAHGGGFERPLLGQHRRRVDEADNAGHRRGGQEAAAGLHYLH